MASVYYVSDAEGKDIALEVANQLCGRCARYPIVDIASGSVKIISEREDDESASNNRRTTTGIQQMDDKTIASQASNLYLGPLGVLSLQKSCPLCRLIFTVFPELGSAEVDSTMPYYLRPFPAYDRQISLMDQKPAGLREGYAIYFAVEREEDAWKTFLTQRLSGTMSTRAADAFAIIHPNSNRPKTALAVRHIGVSVDFDLISSWLSLCDSAHGECCQAVWSEELLQARMIDLRTRTVVPCPSECRYVALSYVWGGIHPELNALSMRTLPQTLEDAITVAERLGFDYLWVDALCVDQFPSAQQAQQLMMMDLIYQCAAVTIIAISGERANAGLPGVSRARPRQTRGFLGGQEFGNIFSSMEQAYEGSTYSTRAWTMQESMLTNRRLVFTNNQVIYNCNTARFSETIDESKDPANYLQCFAPIEWWQRNKDTLSSEERLRSGQEDFRKSVMDYTSRKMTNDIDSLNAFLGVLQYLRKGYFGFDFIWGLPLRTSMQSLRWFHVRHVKPCRRAAFPSWSYVGWEGEISYSGSLDLVRDWTAARIDLASDMRPSYVSHIGHVLELDAYIIDLDIRTEPFSEAYLVGTDKLLGTVKERDFLHPTTLLSQTCKALVVERFSYRAGPDRPSRQELHLLLLDIYEEEYSRRTYAILYVEPGLSIDTRCQRVRLR